MNKIFIAHISNTLNYGSAMMAINLIAGLRERLGSELEIFCDCDDFNLDRLRVATNDQHLKGFIVPKLPTKRSRIKKVCDLLLGLEPIIEEVSGRFQTMIVLGGDDLSESNMSLAIQRALIYKQINRSCQVILAGQSIGPFKGLYKFFAIWLFKGLLVITRDDNSYEYCKKKLKIKNVYQGRDLAFTSLPYQEKWNSICDKLELKSDAYVVAVPSGLVSHYTEDRDGYIEGWKAFIDNIFTRKEVQKIVLLAHVLRPKNVSDKLVINDLVATLSEEQTKNIIVITSEIQPAEARAILGSARFVVTGRMHAAVSTFFSGKPAISLAYSEKYKGVISRGLDLKEMVIDCRSRRWAKDSEIVNEVIKAMDHIDDNYSALKMEIEKKMSRIQGIVREQIEFIVGQFPQ
jgi:colanic acid/amylovoran biosynthesis protein WcaK/AmsJ